MDPLCTNKQNIEAAYLGEIPVDSLEKLPEYIIAERDIEDTQSGNILRTIVRVPTGRIIPNGNYYNISVLDPNNNDITVGENQVVAAYVKNEGTQAVVYPANASNQAQFLIVGKLTDDQILIQPTGVINITAGHEYILGAQYYTGENGEPVTDNATGQKLFIPISNTKLLINLG